MTFRVTVSPVARTDAERIFASLKDRSPSGAASWLEAFQTAVASLEQMALQHGHAEERKLGREVRETFFKTRRGHNYRLLYRIDGRKSVFYASAVLGNRRCDAVTYDQCAKTHVAHFCLLNQHDHCTPPAQSATSKFDWPSVPPKSNGNP
jgi:plasmid stabilization system protein ParE